MVTAIAVVATMAAALTLPVWLRARGRASREAEPVFRIVAARTGGRATPEEGLVLDIDDVQVRVTLQAVVKGQPDIRWYVRARADYVCGSGPAFEIAEQSFVAALGRSVGLRVTDVTFDDAPFEEQFVVRTDDADGVASAWTAAARARFVRIAQQKWAHSDGRTVVVEIEESTPTVALVETVVEIAATVASHGRKRLERLRALPGARAIARATALRGFACVEVIGPHASVTVGPHRDAPVGSLVASTRAPGGPGFGVGLSAGAIEGDVPRGLLSPLAAALLSRVGEAELERDAEELRVVWLDWPDDATIEAGVELLDAISAPPSAGAFR